jgi:hypothetical protein
VTAMSPYDSLILACLSPCLPGYSLLHARLANAELPSQRPCALAGSITLAALFHDVPRELSCMVFLAARFISQVVHRHCSRQPSPSSPCHNLADRCLIDAVLDRKYPQLLSCGTPDAHLYDLHRCQFRTALIFTSVTGAISQLVPFVLSVRPPAEIPQAVVKRAAWTVPCLLTGLPLSFERFQHEVMNKPCPLDSVLIQHHRQARGWSAGECRPEHTAFPAAMAAPDRCPDVPPVRRLIKAFVIRYSAPLFDRLTHICKATRFWILRETAKNAGR